jgi:hypothetical protein
MTADIDLEDLLDDFARALVALPPVAADHRELRLGRPQQPVCIDILSAVDRMGRRALEPLWDVVHPIRTEYLASRRAV